METQAAVKWGIKTFEKSRIYLHLDGANLHIIGIIVTVSVSMTLHHLPNKFAQLRRVKIEIFSSVFYLPKYHKIESFMQFGNVWSLHSRLS